MKWSFQMLIHRENYMKKKHSRQRNYAIVHEKQKTRTRRKESIHRTASCRRRLAMLILILNRIGKA